jgi:hypothetical protein
MLKGGEGVGKAEHTGMRLKRVLAVVAIIVGESIAFSLALLAVMWLGGDVSDSEWLAVAIVGVVYLVVGAVPVPRTRHPLFIAVSAFLVPFAILGWIDWRIEYFLLLEHVGAWENLPRVMLSPTNLGTALFLSCSALVGCLLARRIRGDASEGVGQPSQPSDRW